MTVQRVQGSRSFWAADREDYPYGRGVVVIHGRRVFHEPAALDCSAARIWLDEENQECLRQLIMSNGDWSLPANAAAQEEDDFLFNQCAARGGRVLLTIEHGNETAGRYREGANLVLDCTKKSRR